LIIAPPQAVDFVIAGHRIAGEREYEASVIFGSSVNLKEFGKDNLNPATPEVKVTDGAALSLPTTRLKPDAAELPAVPCIWYAEPEPYGHSSPMCRYHAARVLHF